MGRGFLIANVLGFQAVWFASVIGAAQGLAWAGPVAAAVFVLAHLAYSPCRGSDLRLLGTALLLGAVADSVLVLSGLLDFRSPWPWTFAAPIWIVAMWAGFAMTLNHSLGFLKGRPWVSAGFGLVGGPLAYWGAARAFEAVSFGPRPLVALAVLGLVWAVAMPLLYRVAQGPVSAGRAHEATA